MVSDYIVKLFKTKSKYGSEYHSVEITVSATDRESVAHFADDLQETLNSTRPHHMSQWSTSVRAVDVSGG